MARKTNKTSHVLNLITNGPSAPEDEMEHKAEEQKSEEQKTEKQKAEHKESEAKTEAHKAAEHLPSESAGSGSTAAVSTTPESAAPDTPVVVVPAGEKRVIVVDESTENQKIETQILDQLTTHLEKEEKEKAEKEESKGEEFHIINVMEEVLALKNLKKYMEDYGVCTCSRCQADVRALALTGLPSKYMVVQGESVSPLIGYYESKFKAKVLAEIIKSCIEVREHPRH